MMPNIQKRKHKKSRNVWTGRRSEKAEEEARKAAALKEGHRQERIAADFKRFQEIIESPDSMQLYESKNASDLLKGLPVDGT